MVELVWRFQVPKVARGTLHPRIRMRQRAPWSMLWDQVWRGLKGRGRRIVCRWMKFAFVLCLERLSPFVFPTSRRKKPSEFVPGIWTTNIRLRELGIGRICTRIPGTRVPRYPGHVPAHPSEKQFLQEKRIFVFPFSFSGYPSFQRDLLP